MKKKRGYTSMEGAPKRVNELANIIDSSSIDSMNSDVLRKEDKLNYQPISTRGYVADVRNENPVACIPVNGINESTREQQRGSLDISCHRWRRCKACVREISPASVDAVDKKSNELADSIKSLSIDSANSDVNCQRFSMRGYVAEKANMNPKACIPFDGITENRWEQLRGSLGVPQYRWWRCSSCVPELVTSSTTAQDFSIKLRVDGGSQKKNNTKPPAKDVNKVDSIGESETEIPYNVSLELLASVAVEMTSDQPQLLRTSETSGMGTHAVVKEGAKALNVFTDVIDSDDEREYKKTRPLKELLWVENKAPAETGERPSSSNGSQKKNNTKPPAKDINKVDSIGESETEIPYNVSLELLASVAVEIMTSDQPQLMETSQASQRKDTSFERETSGFETDVVVEEGDKALNVFTDVIDSDDERENKKTRLMKELIWVENKVSAGKGIATQTLQQTGERPSSSIGQEFFRAQGSRKAKRSSPFLPNINPVSTKHAKTTGSVSHPLISGKSNYQK